MVDKKIKPDSLDFQIKIADLGLCRTETSLAQFATKGMGTIHWMAPEIFSDNIYNQKTDVYAFSLMIWEIFAEKIPYEDITNPVDIIQFVYVDNKRPSLDELPKSLDDILLDMIEVNWDRNPQTRDTFQEIVEIFENHFKLN